MRILLKNSVSEIITGGKDNLVAPDLLRRLREYMSIDVPGAFFSQAYKKHVWDGKKYFITPKGKTATGFLPLILKYMDEEYPTIEVEIDDLRDNVVTLNKKLEITIGDNKMEGKYEHQAALVKAYNHHIEYHGRKIHFPRGVINAATNAGKTTIFAAIYKNSDKKMLLLIHRKTIYKQLVETFTEEFGEVGEINDKKYEIKDITIAMAPSLANRVKSYVAARDDVYSFDILAVDESHRAGSKTYLNIFKYSNAYMRVFMSGTALDSDDDIAKLLIIGNSGPKLADVSKVELMKKGVSTPVSVRFYQCNTMLFDYIEGYDKIKEECIMYSTERVTIMGQICAKASGPVIIAVEEIQHGEFISDNLRISKSWTLTHGEDPKQDEKIQMFKDGKIDVLISTGILKEGVNIPVITDIIYATGGKSKVSIKQWMGRGERLDEGKDEVIMHDFYDIGKYIRKHSEARLKLYTDEGMPILSNFALKDARKLSEIIVK